MLGLGSTRPIDPLEQEKNNRHQIIPVFAVLVVLAICCFLFTKVHENLGVPSPKKLAQQYGVFIPHIFDSEGDVDCELSISSTSKYKSDDERLIFFSGVSVTFLLVYFFPLRFKPGLLAVSFVILVCILYGIQNAALLTAAHILVYFSLHPLFGKRLRQGALPGILGWIGLTDDFQDKWSLFLYTIPSGFLSYYIYKLFLLPLLESPRFAKPLQTFAIHSAMIITFTGATVEGLGGEEWKIPLGIALFFWHWLRLFMYHMDYLSGQVPKDLSLMSYLAIFFNPGAFPNWYWGAATGQGYCYVTSRFYSKDKNQLIWDGLKIWGWAIFYLAIGDWIKYSLVNVVRDFGIPVFWRLREMGCHFVDGGSVSLATVWATTLFDQIKWFLLMAGVMHFKVGLWRICGYDVEPFLNRPWLATNIVNLWGRLTLHFRDFLIRCFYYPVFFRCFKKKPYLRIFAAVFAAAAVGNLVSGNMVRRLIHRGMEWKYIDELWVTWPHYFFLVLGIYISAVWLLKKKNKTRQPWTLDKKLPLDILAMAFTLQYYSLTHIFFYRCSYSTVWDNFRLFFVAFGIHIE